MATDPELKAHQEWLGYVQPVGLLVSAPALAASGVHVNRNIVRQQQELVALTVEDADGRRRIDDLPAFFRRFLGWEESDVAGAPGGPPLPADLEVALPEFADVLRPDYAVPDPDKAGAWLMLVGLAPAGSDLDRAPDGGAGWPASAHARFERLLRETEVPIGLLSNGTHLRLIYAPRQESTGYATFPVSALCEVPGRPMVSALHMLLSAERLFSVATAQRLPALLRESRKYQNDVSTVLAEQVLAALYELLRGIQAADAATRGALLGDVVRHDPQEVYGGLLATLLRLVFVLYAEDRGLLGDDPSDRERRPKTGVYERHYSVTGLYERLRADAGRHPDTMDQRYGAWAQLLTLFRLIHDGGSHGSLRLPPRHGRLFDPDTYDFLEGRPHDSRREDTARLDPPRVPDGVVLSVLEKLLIVDGERISYRALDVEQIGSVYEAMMGFELRVARGPSIAVRPQHVVVDLQALLELPAGSRAKWLKEEAACEVKGAAADALKAAGTVDDVLAALAKRLSPRTPNVIPKGGLYLQPTEERRRSGSHYTPRSLTEPIVRTTLTPVLARVSDRPTPEQILALKVCDPAMGSGAFLVEACRFLADALVEAWQREGTTPPVAPGDSAVWLARRMVAERCLYGVDKNRFAVDLAKLSLWLFTLARDHPFTFLDHALWHGDSLVGLTREQIACFDWEPGDQVPIIRQFLDEELRVAEARRAELHALSASDDTEAKARLLAEAVKAVDAVRLAGDLVVAAFFEKEKPRDRETVRTLYREQLLAVLLGEDEPGKVRRLADELRKGPKPVPPFHWEIEFPEVFSRENPGFDAIVGNPPFAGKNNVINANHYGYLDWLQSIHSETHGNSDIVAHFFRRSFDNLRIGGAFGLIGKNTIAQGDTRTSGLRWICTHGGTIFAARRRVKWPTRAAAVVVSVVHLAKGLEPRPFLLDGREVPRITAFLFHDGGHEDPAQLHANKGKSFIGSYLLGTGFTFDDDNPDATPLAVMERLIAMDPRNRERIFPYIGGEEVNDSPTHAHRRYVIDFGDLTEDEARAWPDLMKIVEENVKPKRLTDKRAGYRKYWWRYAERRGELYKAIHSLDRVLVAAQTSKYRTLTFLTNSYVLDQKLIVFVLQAAGFAVLHSRIHEYWALFFGSTLEDRPVYTPSDCFETFPFPPDWQDRPELEASGRAYYDFRAALMARNKQGLTKTYNRFHDLHERDPDIVRLRELHDGMDRSVLEAYGWTDLRPVCDFDQEYDGQSEDDERTTARSVRYRWSNEIRDEVLGRLLALNQERAREVAIAGERNEGPSPARRGRKKKPSMDERRIFDA
jgi:hypothetical protein